MAEKDLLILSLSTLPSNLAEYKYITENGKFKCNGVSQLEPGTKYFINYLKDRNLEHIYIVNTAETREPLDDDVIRTIMDNKFLPEEQIRGYNSDNDVVSCMNTVKFFIERIKEYVHNPSEYERLNPEWNLDNYSERIDKPDFFVQIDLEDESEDKKDTFLYEAIYKLCGYIRKEKTNDNDVRLFVNTQGGRRNEMTIIDEAVKMLAIDDINVENSNAVEFNDDKNEPSFIVDTTSTDRILDMVSGMDEFISTGRGNHLKEFWFDSTNWPGEKLIKEEENIVKQIVEISNSISLCDVENFKGNLANLSAMLKRYEALSDDKKNPLFNSFVTTLQNDYDKYDLLVENGPKTIDQIEWCISKELYQQALTLVESKMPDDMVDAGIIHYGNDTELKSFLCDLVKTENGVFNPPPYVLDKDKNGQKIIKEGKEKFVFVRYLFSYRKKYVNVPKYTGKCKINVILKREHNIPIFKPFLGIEGEPDWDDFTMTIAGKKNITELLEKYFILALMRNKVNHGEGDKLILTLETENNPDNVQTVKGELEKFIKTYRGIERCHYHIDYLNPGC